MTGLQLDWAGIKLKEIKMVKKADEMLKDLCFIAVVIAVITFGVHCFAQDEIDITPEPRPSINKVAIDTVKILHFTNTCEITLRYLDENGDYVREEIFRWRDVEDNPDTPELEFSDEFTKLIQLINSKNDINASIRKAVKVKLGL